MYTMTYVMLNDAFLLQHLIKLVAHFPDHQKLLPGTY